MLIKKSELPKFSTKTNWKPTFQLGKPLVHDFQHVVSQSYAWGPLKLKLWKNGRSWVRAAVLGLFQIGCLSYLNVSFLKLSFTNYYLPVRPIRPLQNITTLCCKLTGIMITSTVTRPCNYVKCNISDYVFFPSYVTVIWLQGKVA